MWCFQGYDIDWLKWVPMGINCLRGTSTRDLLSRKAVCRLIIVEKGWLNAIHTKSLQIWGFFNKQVCSVQNLHLKQENMYKYIMQRERAVRERGESATHRPRPLWSYGLWFTRKFELRVSSHFSKNTIRFPSLALHGVN